MPKAKTLTEEDRIRKQLSELPKDDIIKMLRTSIVSNFGLCCNYCIYNGKCAKLGFHDKNDTEYSCGVGISEFLNKVV